MYTALLTAVVTWISANFELPPNYNHPSIKLVPAVEIRQVRLLLDKRVGDAVTFALTIGAVRSA